MLTKTAFKGHTRFVRITSGAERYCAEPRNEGACEGEEVCAKCEKHDEGKRVAQNPFADPCDPEAAAAKEQTGGGGLRAEDSTGSSPAH